MLWWGLSLGRAATGGWLACIVVSGGLVCAVGARRDLGSGLSYYSFYVSVAKRGFQFYIFVCLSQALIRSQTQPRKPGSLFVSWGTASVFWIFPYHGNDGSGSVLA